MAEWEHFDLDGQHPTYTIPPSNRKLRRADKENPNTPSHVVPLSRQAVAILRELQPLTGRGKYLFPGARDARRHMSDGAINAALARIGFKGELVGQPLSSSVIDAVSEDVLVRLRVLTCKSAFAGHANTRRRGYRTHAKVACGYILKDGSTLGAMQVERMNTPLIQRIVDALAAGREANGPQPALPPRPSKANHVLRYLRRLLTWGVQRGYCKHNPARGVQQSKEKHEHQMPRHDVFDALLAFARERCARPTRTKGSLTPYVAPILVLAYNLRLRGIDMTDLTDAHALDEGIRCDRRKGSLTNITEWNEDLRRAWATLVAYRAMRWAAHGRPEPAQASSRFLLVDEKGTQLARNALSLAIGRLKKLAREAGVLKPGDKFSLHGLKHLGVTDTPGNRADKRQASGHKTDAMLDVYDHEVPVVKPPSRKRK